MIAQRGARILIAERDAALGESLRETLLESGYRVSLTGSGREALDLLRRELPALVILAADLPDVSGPEMTERIGDLSPATPVIILADAGSLESAARAMKSGATDFLVKPIQAHELQVRIARSVAADSPRLEPANSRSTTTTSARYGEMIGDSAELRKIFGMIERVAEMPALVLIEGEPGTGKELIARAIHDRGGKSGRGQSSGECDHPYIAVNCGALSRTLLESQLFGHKKGTFTGAVADQDGVFVAAGKGTLFLDEITELDLDLQVKLLRALQEREVTPLGATQPLPVHARIITATNRDIAALVKAGKFRADLYYRINVLNVRVPALRERGNDISLLVDYFMKGTAERYGVAPREVSSEAMSAFRDYAWPGNVRELQNVIERAFALGQHEQVLRLEDLPPEIGGAGGGDSRSALSRAGSGRVAFLSYDQAIRQHVLRALEASRGIKSRAADLLQIDRSRLYRLMQKYRISDSTN